MKERSFYDAFMMQLILCVPSIQGIAHSLVFLVLGLVKKPTLKQSSVYRYIHVHVSEAAQCELC